jgi:hypothetical protein
MYSTFAFGKLSTEGDFERLTIQRNQPADEDVQFDIGWFIIIFKHLDFFNNNLFK